MYPAAIDNPNIIPSIIITVLCFLLIIGSDNFAGFLFIISLSAESVLIPTAGRDSIIIFDHSNCRGKSGTGYPKRGVINTPTTLPMLLVKRYLISFFKF